MNLSNKLILVVLVSPFIVCAMQENTFIPGASYYIVEGNERSIFHGIGGHNKHVTFYDADNNALKVLSREECDFLKAKAKLDPLAPRPKVATYAIKWWPAISVGWGMRKGAPGYFVVLKDKHGNYIARFRYDEKTKQITVSFSPDERKANSVYELRDFDTSNCVEQDSDPIKH